MALWTASVGVAFLTSNVVLLPTIVLVPRRRPDEVIGRLSVDWVSSGY